MILDFLKLFCCVGLFRLNFGGGSSSSSAQSTTQNDNRMTIGSNGIAATGGSIVQVLDGGAIGNSFGFANAAFDKAISGMGAAGANALNVVSTANKDALNFAAGADTRALDFATGQSDSAYSFAKSANTQAANTLAASSNLISNAYADAKGRGALTDKILIGAIAMAGVVAVMALKK